jgi:transposase
VEWYEGGSSQTKAYEDHLLWPLVNSTVVEVEKKEGVGYETLMGVIHRRVASAVDGSKITHLEVLGVDEIALTKGHKDFVAMITDRVGDKKLILGVLEAREKATVKAFFSSLPKRLRRTLRAVCTDRYEGFVNAAKEVFGKRVRMVVDRFHGAKRYRSGVDTVRKKELRRLKKELPEEEFKKLKGALWAWRRSLQKRTPEDEAILRELFKYSPELKTAYYLSGILTDIFNNTRSKRSARWPMRRWIALVKGSGLECFDKFLGTLDRALEEILNDFVDRDSSGFVEGLNNKIKVIKRRGYGILNTTHLFQRLYLDLGNYHDFSGKVRYS